MPWATAFSFSMAESLSSMKSWSIHQSSISRSTWPTIGPFGTPAAMTSSPVIGKVGGAQAIERAPDLARAHPALEHRRRCERGDQAVTVGVGQPQALGHLGRAELV